MISEALNKFFWVEIRNEDHGGVRPATLESAKDSFDQAPEDVLDEWMEGLGRYNFGELQVELEKLIERNGPNCALSALVRSYKPVKNQNRALK